MPYVFDDHTELLSLMPMCLVVAINTLSLQTIISILSPSFYIQ